MTTTEGDQSVKTISLRLHGRGCHFTEVRKVQISCSSIDSDEALFLSLGQVLYDGQSPLQQVKLLQKRILRGERIHPQASSPFLPSDFESFLHRPSSGRSRTYYRDLLLMEEEGWEIFVEDRLSESATILLESFLLDLCYVFAAYVTFRFICFLLYRPKTLFVILNIAYFEKLIGYLCPFREQNPSRFYSKTSHALIAVASSLALRTLIFGIEKGDPSYPLAVGMFISAILMTYWWYSPGPGNIQQRLQRILPKARFRGLMEGVGDRTIDDYVYICRNAIGLA